MVSHAFVPAEPDLEGLLRAFELHALQRSQMASLLVEAGLRPPVENFARLHKWVHDHDLGRVGPLSFLGDARAERHEVCAVPRGGKLGHKHQGEHLLGVAPEALGLGGYRESLRHYGRAVPVHHRGVLRGDRNSDDLSPLPRNRVVHSNFKHAPSLRDGLRGGAAADI